MGILKYFFGLLFLLFSFQTYAQQAPVKVAVFAPVYIDSAFIDNEYKLGNNNLPKYILPGLEFYNGVMMAIDSLRAEGQSVELFFYDTKSSKEPLTSIIQKPEMKEVTLIIASFNNRSELKTLADYAAAQHIPLISATYPNDGGITHNPYFILVNSTLRTHCEELYKYIQRYYATNKMIYIRRKGTAGDVIQSVFEEQGRTTPAIPLKNKTVELTDTFSIAQLTGNLDSIQRNVVFCGSLDDNFSMRVVRTISAAKKFPCTIIGMPTWDGLQLIDDNTSGNIEIIFSTPYHFVRSDKAAQSIIQKYKMISFGRPSDMVFKGFEATYHFVHLVQLYPTSFLQHLSDKHYSLFNEFDFQPVKNRSNATITDRVENRKLYFIKKP